MEGIMLLLLTGVGLIVLIVIFRLFGAWMFRINEIITQQKITNQLLNDLKSNKSKDEIMND